MYIQTEPILGVNFVTLLNFVSTQQNKDAGNHIFMTLMTFDDFDDFDGFDDFDDFDDSPTDRFEIFKKERINQ